MYDMGDSPPRRAERRAKTAAVRRHQRRLEALQERAERLRTKRQRRRAKREKRRGQELTIVLTAHGGDLDPVRYDRVVAHV